MHKKKQNGHKVNKKAKRKQMNKMKQKIHQLNGSAQDLFIKKQSLKYLVRSKLRLSYAKVDGDHMGQVYELVLSQVEPPLIEMALEKTEHNQVKAAEILGINRNTLRKRILKYNIKAWTKKCWSAEVLKCLSAEVPKCVGAQVSTIISRALIDKGKMGSLFENWI